MKKKIFLVLSFLILIIPPYGNLVVAGLGGEWVIEGEGFAVYNMAADENYLYLVGTDSSMDQWRIEKRFLSNGSLVSSFGSNGVVLTNHSAWGNASAYGIAIDGEFMYVVGFSMGYSDPWGKIEKRKLTDGSLIWASDGIRAVIYYDVAVDNNYLYLVGTRKSGGSYSYALIEKRRLSDGGLIWSVEDQWTTGYQPVNVLSGVAIDNEYLYAVGVTGAGSFINKQYMLKRFLSTGAPDTNFKLNGHWAEGSGEYTDVIVDDFLYIIGYENLGSGDYRWVIDKRDKVDGDYVLWSSNPWIYGRIISNPSSRYDVAQAFVKEGDDLYIVGYDCNTTQGDSQWRIEKRKLANGALDSAFGEGGVITVDPRPGQAESPFAIVKKGNYIYVGGTPSWRVQSFLVSHLVYLPLIIKGQ